MRFRRPTTGFTALSCCAITRRRSPLYSQRLQPTEHATSPDTKSPLNTLFRGCVWGLQTNRLTFVPMPKLTAHPGIKFKSPKLGCPDQCGTCEKCEADKRARMPYYRAVFLSPASGKEVTIKVDSPELDRIVATPVPKTASERTRRQERIGRILAEWGRRKRLDLDAEKLKPASAKPSGKSVDEARDRFFEDKKELRKSTRTDYMSAIKMFTRWCTESKTTLDTLDVDRLRKFRSWCYDQPMRRQMTGHKRGIQEAREGSRRSPWTINSDLSGASIFLHFCLRMKYLPLIAMDEIEYGLERYDTEPVAIDYMRPAQLKVLLVAAERHDAECFEMTREEKARGKKGGTLRYTSIMPLIIGAILSGMRLAELCLVTFKTHLNLYATDFDDNEVGEFKLKAHETKTKRARDVTFEVSPILKRLVEVLDRLHSGKGTVFGVTKDEAETAMRRLRDEFGAPKNFSWQLLRKTCDTYLNCAPGIYGARAGLFAPAQIGGSAFAAAAESGDRQGHTQKVARDFYIKIVKGMPKDATTLEAAMGLESVIKAYIDGLERSLDPRDNVVRLRRR